MKLTLKNKFTEAGNAVTFIFTPEKPIKWVAGQYMRHQLNTVKGLEEHYFTISSAPYEKHIQITTRISNSTFKQKLNNLKPGDAIESYGPMGDFVWVDTDKQRVFVAGGIGVTPYHSILKQRSHNGIPIPVILLYAIRDEDIPFKAEVDRWRNLHHEFAAVYLVGDKVNGDLISKHVPNLSQSLVYLSGPEPMVEALAGELTKVQGLPEKQLIQDWFPGYTEKNY